MEEITDKRKAAFGNNPEGGCELVHAAEAFHLFLAVRSHSKNCFDLVAAVTAYLSPALGLCPCCNVCLGLCFLSHDDYSFPNTEYTLIAQNLFSLCAHICPCASFVDWYSKTAR